MLRSQTRLAPSSIREGGIIGKTVANIGREQIQRQETRKLIDVDASTLCGQQRSSHTLDCHRNKSKAKPHRRVDIVSQWKVQTRSMLCSFAIDIDLLSNQVASNNESMISGKEKQDLLTLFIVLVPQRHCHCRLLVNSKRIDRE